MPSRQDNNPIKLYRYCQNRILLLLLLVILVLSNRTYPQSESLKFRHLTSDNGLSQNFISSILQDQRGFMWFGTKDGLNRYDGYSFVIYQHDPFDSTTLSENFITSLFEDSRGYIWVGTLNGDLNCFERDSETFHHIRYRSIVDENINTAEIKSIVEDAKGNIWIGTRGDGIFKLSFKRKNSFEINYKQFFSQPDKSGTLSSNIVSTLFIDSKGVLWIGTLNSLDRFNFESESFTHHEIQNRNPNAPDGPFNKNVFSICESSNGDLWLGTVTGLAKFERQTGNYKIFPHHFAVFRYGWGNIVQISKDNSGKLWLASPAELMSFDPATLSYEYFKNDPLNPNSISYNSISSLWIDKTGILWVGTSGMGINLYDPKTSRFSTLQRINDPKSRISGFSVRSVLEESDEIMWVSTDVLSRWNRRTGEIKSFETSSNRPNDFGNTGAWSMIMAHNGIIWTATTEGVYSYDPSNAKTKQYKFNPLDSSGIPQKEVYAVFEDQQKNIWVATENFFCRLD